MPPLEKPDEKRTFIPMCDLRPITVAFTGHRRYAGESDEALRGLVRRLYGEGYRIFWSGMARGFDLAAAEAVAELRGELPGLRLHCAVPWAGQAGRFALLDRGRHAALLAAADEAVVLAEGYSPRCCLLRDEYMVDRASVVAAWYDGRPGGTRYTWEYARRRGCRRINLWEDPQTAFPF